MTKNRLISRGKSGRRAGGGEGLEKVKKVRKG